jgi:hypothetical protein
MALCREGGPCGTRPASPGSCGWEIIRGRQLREVTGPKAGSMTWVHATRTRPRLSGPRGTQRGQSCGDRLRRPRSRRDVPRVRLPAPRPRVEDPGPSGAGRGGLEEALPSERAAGPARALALAPRQAGDLPGARALTPRQREPGGDGGQVLLEPPGEADAGVDPALRGLGDPGLPRLAPASPPERQQRLGPRVDVGDGDVPLAALLPIGPRRLRPGGVGAHPGA